MLALHLALTSATAILYGLLAVLLGRRPTTPEARLPLNLFRAWWAALAVYTSFGPIQVALLRLGALPLWMHETFREAGLLAITVGLWGLLSYLIYAYRGWHGAWRPLGVVYIIVAVMLLGVRNYVGAPGDLTIRDGAVSDVSPVALTPGIAAFILILLVGPQLVAAMAYARLYSRADTPTQRYRIALVSLALIGWLGSTLAGEILQVEGGLWTFAMRLLALLAPALVLVAYFPPAFLRRRYGLVTLGREPAVPPALPVDPRSGQA